MRLVPDWLTPKTLFLLGLGLIVWGNIPQEMWPLIGTVWVFVALFWYVFASIDRAEEGATATD